VGWHYGAPRRSRRAAAAQDEARALAEALRTLPATERALIELRVARGLPLPEAAAQLGTSTEAARLLQLRALRALAAARPHALRLLGSEVREAAPLTPQVRP
jgi:RNA polymerase sigma factor (sigma-70 family)